MKKIIHLILPHRASFILAVIMLFAASLFTAALIGTTKPLMDEILIEKPADSKVSRVDELFAFNKRILNYLKSLL